MIRFEAKSEMFRSVFAASLLVLFLALASIPARADGFNPSEQPQGASINTSFTESHTKGFDAGEFGGNIVTSSLAKEEWCGSCNVIEGLTLHRVDLDSDSDSRKPRKHHKDPDPDPTETPEPASLALLGTGFLGMAWIRRSRNSSSRRSQQVSASGNQRVTVGVALPQATAVIDASTFSGFYATNFTGPVGGRKRMSPDKSMLTAFRI